MGALASPPRRAIVFIGFMGSGKSTAAAELAEALGVRCIDSDAEIERRLGRSIPAQFETDGEQAFRGSEERVVLELLESAPAGSAVSLGGGSVLSERVRDALSGHLVVLLDIDPAEAWERVCGGDVERPLARRRESFMRLHRERAPIYERLAHAILPARVRGVARRALPGLRALEAAPAGTAMLWASADSGEYPVLVGRGLLTQGLLAGGAPAAGAWPLERGASRPFCVSDRTVAPLYAAALGELASLVTFPAGERHKTVATAETVWRALLSDGMTRADHVVALGGGVVGDLAGFCAATYQRGVPVVQVPTTLVSQVDSAYGGKTGVDLPEGKNYVGAYHQPAGVIVDPDALSSLPQRELAAGWVEVVKTALIAGGALWERVSADEPVDERMIIACARTKLEVVAQDERDGGVRQVLNLGHTIGHAIETASRYGRYLHGEAVGLGLLAALRLSGQERLRQQVHALMELRGLPTRLTDVPVGEVAEAVGRDKKRIGSEVPFVLVNAPGEVEIGRQVDGDEVHAAIAELSG